MCDVAAIGPAVSAIGGAMAASQANAERRRQYQYQLKVRERKWMQERSLYQTKITQFDQEVDLANVAAQRAYTRTQISLNNAQAQAILENQEDFKTMIQGEGALQASFAERGVGGKGMGRALVMNKANYGLSQAMRSRGLTMASYRAKQYNEDVNRQLKSYLNKSFSDVAISPVPDVAPPAPVMQNVGMTLMLGMANAVGAGLEGQQTQDWRNRNLSNQTPSFTPTYIKPSFSGGNPYTTNYQPLVPVSKSFQPFT